MQLLLQGKVEIQGSPNDLSKSGIDFASLLTSSDETAAGSDETAMTVRRSLSRTDSRMSIKSSKSISESDSKSIDESKADGKSVEALQQMEGSSKGQVKGSVSGTYFTSGANFLVLAVVLILFALTQALASGADYWVSFWTSQEELRTFYSNISDPEAESSFNETEQVDLNANGLLTTETLIYIHGGLMAALFTIALCR